MNLLNVMQPFSLQIWLTDYVTHVYICKNFEARRGHQDSFQILT